MSDKQVMAVVYRCADGTTDWNALSKDEVPNWLKDDKEAMGKLIADPAVCARENGADDFWYRVEVVEPAANDETIQ